MGGQGLVVAGKLVRERAFLLAPSPAPQRVAPPPSLADLHPWAQVLHELQPSLAPAPRFARAPPAGMLRLLHTAPWDPNAVRDALVQYVLGQVGDPHAVLVLAKTGFPKNGSHSVGGPPQVLRCRRQALSPPKRRLPGLCVGWGAAPARPRTLPASLRPGRAQQPADRLDPSRCCCPSTRAPDAWPRLSAGEGRQRLRWDD